MGQRHAAEPTVAVAAMPWLLRRWQAALASERTRAVSSHHLRPRGRARRGHHREHGGRVHGARERDARRPGDWLRDLRSPGRPTGGAPGTRSSSSAISTGVSLGCRGKNVAPISASASTAIQVSSEAAPGAPPACRQDPPARPAGSPAASTRPARSDVREDPVTDQERRSRAHRRLARSADDLERIGRRRASAPSCMASLRRHRPCPLDAATTPLVASCGTRRVSGSWGIRPQASGSAGNASASSHAAASADRAVEEVGDDHAACRALCARRASSSDRRSPRRCGLSTNAAHPEPASEPLRQAGHGQRLVRRPGCRPPRRALQLLGRDRLLDEARPALPRRASRVPRPGTRPGAVGVEAQLAVAGSSARKRRAQRELPRPAASPLAPTFTLSAAIPRPRARARSALGVRVRRVDDAVDRDPIERSARPAQAGGGRALQRFAAEIEQRRLEREARRRVRAQDGARTGASARAISPTRRAGRSSNRRGAAPPPRSRERPPRATRARCRRAALPPPSRRGRTVAQSRRATAPRAPGRARPRSGP